MESETSPSGILEFLFIVGQLKTQKRMGWVNHRVHLPESISDHMYRMAIMRYFAHWNFLTLSFLVQDKEINKNKCMKLALVHDMAEAIVGK